MDETDIDNFKPSTLNHGKIDDESYQSQISGARDHDDFDLNAVALNDPFYEKGRGSSTDTPFRENNSLIIEQNTDEHHGLLGM